MNNLVRYQAVFLLILINSAELFGLQGGLQVASYFDSNVREAVSGTEPALGLKLRGNLEHFIGGQRWRIDGKLLSQTYLDLISPSQSKLIVNSGLDYRYNLNQVIQASGGFSHFQKLFYQDEYSYRWTDYHLALFGRLTNRLSMKATVSNRLTNFSTLDSIRFAGMGGDLKISYQPNRNWLAEAVGGGLRTTFRNYHALEVVDDTSFIELDEFQQDESRFIQLHCRYQRKVIAGLMARYENVSSNSVTGGYSLLRGRAYISFRIGKSVMAHFILQRVNKIYEHQDLSAVSSYRDPEERNQNRTYFKLEKDIILGGVGYIQLSRLKNETILNQQYYNKIIGELGVKFKL